MENKAPERIYSNFDEFFTDMSKQYSLGNLHKEAISAHFDSLKIKNNQNKWQDGFKHYLGIK